MADAKVRNKSDLEESDDGTDSSSSESSDTSSNSDESGDDSHDSNNSDSNDAGKNYCDALSEESWHTCIFTAGKPATSSILPLPSPFLPSRGVSVIYITNAAM